MAANQLVQARIDGAVKEEAAAVLAAMGLTVSDAVRLLLTRIAQEKALPFAPLIPNAVTIAAMKEARKGGLPQFDSVQALMDRSACAGLSAPASSGAITSARPEASTGRHSTPDLVPILVALADDQPLEPRTTTMR